MGHQETTYQNLKSWMILNGWKPICDLKPHVFETTGRGLMTLEQVQANNVVLKIPKSLLITTTTVSQSSIGKLFSQKSYTAQCVLATYLIHQRHLGVESFWKPYLDSLPLSYTNPEFCTKSEKSHLPDFLTNELNCTKRKLNSSYLSLVGSIKLQKSQHCDHCQESYFDIFDYHSFVWAYYTVNTRSIYLNNNSDKSSKINILGDDDMAMAPLLDLFNHNCETVADASLVEQSYQIKALRSYNPGSQVFINYGSHSNIKLYLEYGFFIPNNALDQICFNLSDIQKFKKVSKSTCTFIKTSQFDKSMGFTCEGLNYNAKIVLFIVTNAHSSSSNESSLKQKIYRDGLSPEDLKISYSLALVILQSIRNEYELTLKRMVKIKKRSDSFDVSVGFVQECIRVLDKSFVVLNT